MFAIIVGLIVSLVVVAIVINAVQQHKAKQEAEKRTEIAKQKSVIDETESVLMSASQFSISPKLVWILHQRIQNALKIIYELNPTLPEIKQRVRDAEERVQSIDVNASSGGEQSAVNLPENDKMIIQMIQSIKKLRVLLRAEHSKGKVDTQTYMYEDKILERMQLKVNVETLARRGRNAMSSNMLGSARQYFEKAIGALEAQTQPDEYVQTRRAELGETLREIQNNLKNVNAQDREKKKAAERDELDELFAPKRKW
ncbi:hypothetical protein [Alteromonas oceanisediminis]|uniref:hypothetical protein n=1 Tax=Alteromonas oceanisediminis TaxID=2836180 RepID=UPI001BDA3ECB|nr:hypothetical protein [Alteromonas oceanisediminis]MBT0587165.1 hypothetical protein [Alteromonas oceanisediminis]